MVTQVRNPERSWIVAEILDHGFDFNQVKRYLVQWLYCENSHNKTWEREVNLTGCKKLLDEYKQFKEPLKSPNFISAQMLDQQYINNRVNNNFSNIMTDNDTESSDESEQSVEQIFNHKFEDNKLYYLVSYCGNPAQIWVEESAFSDSLHMLEEYMETHQVIDQNPAIEEPEDT